MMKTSGSKRSNLINGRYANTRHLQHLTDIENLPAHEAIKSTKQFYNGKINYGLLVRFLRSNVNRDWDEVYSEIVARIPSKLLDYKEMIFWFVADKVELIDGKLWNKKSQKYIWTEGKIEPLYYPHVHQAPQLMEFYVHPETNKLIRIEQRVYKRLQG